MSTYNHVYSIAFELPGSIHPSGDDVSQDDLAIAILRRLANLVENNELIEAVGYPDDTYEEIFE